LTGEPGSRNPLAEHLATLASTATRRLRRTRLHVPVIDELVSSRPQPNRCAGVHKLSHGAVSAVDAGAVGMTPMDPPARCQSRGMSESVALVGAAADRTQVAFAVPFRDVRAAVLRLLT
jgi:hypothetical protein